jgi:site-specific recombinase XerD/regulator of replication initiation timing
MQRLTVRPKVLESGINIGESENYMANWKNDPYVKEWLSKVSKRTKQNYTENFPRWLAFIQMSPTEQIQKRFKDLQSSNPKERGFFEDKVIEYKNALVVQGLKPNTIASYRIPIQSFFSAHRVPLKFRRGELKVEEVPEDKVVKEWIPDNQQMKQIYQHGAARDRALMLVLYQSGFSETDVSDLNVEDLPEITATEGHYPITMHRGKTGVLQRTCISEEAVHDIKAMLEEREAKGQLEHDKDGKTPLFISQKGERLTTRFINDAIKAMVEKTYGQEDAAKFKTKSLRDAYNDALLRANLTQELKDTLFGHIRKGAKEKYAVSQQTIIDSYNRAFQYMTVNHGTQARKDIEVMRSEMIKMSQLVVKMSEETVRLREENKALKQKLDGIEITQVELKKSITQVQQDQKRTQRDLLKLRKVG